MIKQNVEWNISKWNDQHDWPESGEEWSKEWGNSVSQWRATILPRITNCLPARNIVEIAPGWGRWTRFLLPSCSNYLGFDLSEKAVRQCQQRFCFDDRAKFFLNDGKSIEEVKSKSADFIFSMDSLVHAEVDAMEPYVQEFARVLSEYGTGFIHHSNMAEHDGKNVSNVHDRAKSISADVFRQLCEKHGLQCIAQEKINWGQAETNDCFSLFARSGAFKGKSAKVLVNDRFHLEIENAGRIFEAFSFDF